MQQAAFMAKIDIEPGDIVHLGNEQYELEIQDIRTIHYLVAQTVEFEFKLRNPKTGMTISRWYKRERLIVKRYNDGRVPKPTRQ